MTKKNITLLKFSQETVVRRQVSRRLPCKGLETSRKYNDKMCDSKQHAKRAKQSTINHCSGDEMAAKLFFMVHLVSGLGRWDLVQ